MICLAFRLTSGGHFIEHYLVWIHCSLGSGSGLLLLPGNFHAQVDNYLLISCSSVWTAAVAWIISFNAMEGKTVRSSIPCYSEWLSVLVLVRMMLKSP